MEQGQCWIQTKRKYSMSSNLASSYGDSWEEQAFAEDAAAAGSVGGCIWPPRSYSCCFCRREFRSAQALGGHMNVHRKDRARLKQPSSDPHNEIHPTTTKTSSLGYNNNNNLLLYPSPVCGLVYQTNPNSNSSSHLDHNLLTTPPSDYSKSFLASLNGKSRDETLIPFYNSPLNSSESWPTRDQRLYSSKLHPQVDTIEKVLKNRVFKRGNGNSNGNDGDDDDDDSDITLSLNHLVVCNKDEDMICKKRKTEASSNQFFSKTFDMEQKLFGFSPSSIEELDLELRLGTRSKV